MNRGWRDLRRERNGSRESGKERAPQSRETKKKTRTERQRERDRVGTVVELGFMMVKTTVGKGIYGVTTNPWEVM